MKRNKFISVFLSLAFILLTLSSCAVHNKPEDETGIESGSQPAIAATSVAICEILDKLGYDNVIGVPETERELPERYKGAEKIGAPMTPDLEKIKSLSPDLVLSPKTLENSLASQYGAAGISSAFLDLSSVEGMYAAIGSLGKLLDRQAEASKLSDEYKTYMDTYHTGEDGPNVLLLMAFPDGFLLVASEDSYVGDLVKLAGGKNVYADYKSDQEGFININPEDMIQKKPDRILVFAHYNEEAAFEYMKKEFSSNTAWQFFEAVENGNITYLPSKYFGMSATLSWTDALEYLEPVFYGENDE